MEKISKTYTLKLTDKELKNTPLRIALTKVIGERLKLQKSQKYFKISSVEHQILRKHFSWVSVEVYAPKNKDRLNGEIGKYNGKRCILKGRQ